MDNIKQEQKCEKCEEQLPQLDPHWNKRFKSLIISKWI